MSITSPDFQQLADWASPAFARRAIGIGSLHQREPKKPALGRRRAKAIGGFRGEILHAIREPPHLSVNDVDELEHSQSPRVNNRCERKGYLKRQTLHDLSARYYDVQRPDARASSHSAALG